MQIERAYTDGAAGSRGAVGRYAPSVTPDRHAQRESPRKAQPPDCTGPNRVRLPNQAVTDGGGFPDNPPRGTAGRTFRGDCLYK